MNSEKGDVSRPHSITNDYLHEIDKHLADIVKGRAIDMYEVRDFASILHIHPTHLSNTIREVTGHHPCYFLEEKILAVSKKLLEDSEMNISDIASLLTYDPSNFTKFFKKFSGVTPKQYRESFLELKKN